jgi:hypothetical protein
MDDVRALMDAVGPERANQLQVSVDLGGQGVVIERNRRRKRDGFDVLATRPRAAVNSWLADIFRWPRRPRMPAATVTLWRDRPGCPVRGCGTGGQACWSGFRDNGRVAAPVT